MPKSGQIQSGIDGQLDSGIDGQLGPEYALLSCKTLSFSASCRFIPALGRPSILHAKNGTEKVGVHIFFYEPNQVRFSRNSRFKTDDPVQSS